MTLNVISCVLTSNPQSFLNLLSYFTSFSLFQSLIFYQLFFNTYKKVYNFLASYRGTCFFYKQLELLKVEVPKWPKTKQLLSTKYCSGSDCLRLKQLRFKLKS